MAPTGSGGASSSSVLGGASLLDQLAEKEGRHALLLQCLAEGGVLHMLAPPVLRWAVGGQGRLASRGGHRCSPGGEEASTAVQSIPQGLRHAKHQQLVALSSHPYSTASWLLKSWPLPSWLALPIPCLAHISHPCSPEPCPWHANPLHLP